MTEHTQVGDVPMATVELLDNPHLHAALPQTHAESQKEHVALQDFARDERVPFARRVYPSFMTKSWTQHAVREPF
jgi:hypothetical protein